MTEGLRWPTVGRIFQHDLLAGWGAPADSLERVEEHVAALERVGPLAPPLPG